MVAGGDENNLEERAPMDFSSMNFSSMNLSSLLTSLLASALAKPINKGATWLVRQTDGKDKGNAQLAANAPVINAVEGAVAGSLAQTALSQVGAAHLTTDKLAKSLGIPTTEEGLIAAGVSAAGSGTLNLSDPASAVAFLAQNLVK